MASSTYARVTRFASSDLAADDPLHTDCVREGIADTLLHLDDEDAQCRVAWIATAAKDIRTTGTPAVANTWYPIVTCGPWPISRKSTGVPFSLVVRIAGSSDAQTFAVKFRAVLAPLLDASAAMAIGGADTLTTVTTVANMTAGWVDDAAAANLVTMTAAQAERAAARQSTLSALAGVPIDVDVCRVYLTIYGSTANVASTPQLYGVYAREYVGL